MLWSVHTASNMISRSSSDYNITNAIPYVFYCQTIRRMQGQEKMSAISTEFSASEFYRNIEHIRRNMIYRTRGGSGSKYLGGGLVPPPNIYWKNIKLQNRQYKRHCDSLKI